MAADLEPLLHVVVPFVALVLYGVEPRRAAPLSLLGVVPDLDALLLVHRSLSHSVVVLGLVWVPVLAYVRMRRPGLWVEAVLGLLVLVSHPVLDMVGGYTPVLWPLYGDSIYLRMALDGRVSPGVSFNPRVEVLGVPTVFKPVASLDYPLFTGEGLAVSLILLLPIVLSMVKPRLEAR